MRLTRKTTIMTTILILFEILGLISSVHAILETRTPQGAIAWVVSLNAPPIVAVPAYWVLGRTKFNGYVSTHKNTSIQIQDELERISKDLHPYLVEAPQTFPEYEAIKRADGTHDGVLVDRLEQISLFHNDRIRLHIEDSWSDIQEKSKNRETRND